MGDTTSGAMPGRRGRRATVATVDNSLEPHKPLARRLSVPTPRPSETVNPTPHSVPSYGMSDCPNPVLFDVNPV
eukprot:CAMPEP_0119431768 /NCGR_PEP_ID=MMETSP1335-20130426/46554_1 /TAXON_ID=259385 /ORGANISM="Chrysoculter rhomboideus, Strain RCC1486" /LENGTH=73 /DNA_ID=CAMNT_0007457575 /DNA_START=1 /DNA_END=218 /DNA_ORIENTATION=-